jgi:large subunit ribosomal protein L4
VTTVDVLDASGNKAGTIELPAEIFDVQVNIPLIHQVVVAQQAAARQGTHSTKNRGEVAGGGRKPYRQKGTGRARQGSIRAPQFAGGGSVNGPTPHDYVQRTPKKMKAAALRGALSDRARDGRVHVVEGLVDGDTVSTKAARTALAKITSRPRTLIVLDRSDDVTWLSLRNVDTIHVLHADQLNTYDVLLSDDVVFTRVAYDTFISGSAGSRAAKPAQPRAREDKVSGSTRTGATAAATTPDSAPDSADATEAAPYGSGSARPLDGGDAPAGYTVKGNSSSMKYHTPEGQWYEQTVADVWFDSVESAEIAGFVEAGSTASIEANEAKDEEADK